MLVAGVDGGASAIIPQLFRNCCGTVAQHLRENGGTATVAQLLRNCSRTVPLCRNCSATVSQLFDIFRNFRNIPGFVEFSGHFYQLLNFPENLEIFRNFPDFSKFPGSSRKCRYFFGCETAAEQLRNSCATMGQFWNSCGTVAEQLRNRCGGELTC